MNAILERRAFERRWPPRYNTKGQRLCVACFGARGYAGIGCPHCNATGIDERYIVPQPRAERCMDIVRRALTQAAGLEAVGRHGNADALGGVAASAVQAAINISEKGMPQ